MRFFLFFLASATAAGPLDKFTRASVVDLGIAGGSEGIVDCKADYVGGEERGVTGEGERICRFLCQLRGTKGSYWYSAVWD